VGISRAGIGAVEDGGIYDGIYAAVFNGSDIYYPYPRLAPVGYKYGVGFAYQR